MAIPPFPSQDLAKLVLGYLAEEQLMTAYDEFLLASPYLDVLRNEYDRIFMTSLKSILAEYRAVKIYVETCKPFILRKKLFQCTNLLEIVKFLVNFIDLNKLHTQDTSQDKVSLNKQASHTRSTCDICSLSNCTCREKSIRPETQTTSHIETATIEPSVETTSLDDLPGNSVPKKKTSRDLSIVSQTSSSLQIIEASAKSQSLSSISTEPNLTKQDGTCELQLQQNNTLINVQDQHLSTKSDESKQKIEEFNNIYNLVCSNNSTLQPKSNLTNIPEVTSGSICNAGSFQEFASGVGGSCDKERTIVPDSSTSENIGTQITETREKKTLHINEITNIKGQSTPQFLLKVGTKSTKASSKSFQQKCVQRSEPMKIRPKINNPDDHKIKIISDVKVDNFKNNNLKGPSKTSTPLLQMQTIVINSTPSYDNNSQAGTNYKYTKDEIMAMPTIIIVPATSSKNHTETTNRVSTTQCMNTETNTTLCTKTNSSTARVLGPLIIDVTSNSTAPVLNKESIPQPILKEVSKVDADKNTIQIVDLTHNSVPKDTNFTTSNKTSTPQIIPPVRKSSSTPRRTSHVRVLDFTTPRRILHETINEQDPNKVSADEAIGENVEESEQTTEIDNKVILKKTDSTKTVIKPSTKENTIKIKKNNWDAELRALAVKNDDSFDVVASTPKPKIVQKKPRTVKKKISHKDENDCKNVKSDTIELVTCENKSKATPKVKKKKKVKNIVDVNDVILVETPIEKVMTECTQKQTINLILENDWSSGCKENLDQFGQAKMNYSDERVDTPETERLSLQNVIGAKLNISDLLETPYKQVLYDIQMETPKFLGPDLPDEPISDIKIMNIPTPRFLNTPKPLQVTPPSYSSRPTDYSSGGSYYKPDEQDYFPSSDVIDCANAVVESTSKPIEKPAVMKSEVKEKEQKSGRPQRKCTRNVSYRSPHIGTKLKEDSSDKISVSSETSTGSRERKANKSVDNKNRLKAKKDDKHRSDKKKVVSKTPIKKATPKKYIRIKPFKKTPVKYSPMKGRKITSNVTSSIKALSRKRTSSKEKNTTIVPVVSAAPTKSRRKSSTPRKLHCTKSFDSDNVEQTSSDLSKNVESSAQKNTTECCHDSDSEQQPLRWSDDGSQDAKTKEASVTADVDDIDKIKEFIETSVPNKDVADENSLHNDLVKRGFDVETAKIIERDLLDTTPVQETAVRSADDNNLNRIEVCNVSDKVDSDGSFSNALQIVQDEEDFEEEEIELSSCECNEETDNYITCEFDETKFVAKEISKLKDKFSIEMCIEDGVSIRLRAMPFENIFEISEEEIREYNPKETEAAVNSIMMDKLYTPMKDAKAQCYELFDSTLTSIDTPLKSEAPYETTVTEIVLEVENVDKMEGKKRKRLQSGNSDDNSNKKSKPDTQYLLNTANIQNIDIESVLSKLHGP